MKTRHILWAILALFLALPHSGTAQTPEDDPFHVPTLTLSKGKYIEIHDQDSIVQIGRALLNVKTQQLVGWAEEDTTYGNDAFQADVASRWLSPDPKSDEFSSWSPYNFVEDNPIRLIDPDGMAAVLPEGLGKPAEVEVKEGKKSIPTPLTTYKLREMARKNGFPGNGIVFNRMVGKAFEETALKAINNNPKSNTVPYGSSERFRFTGGPKSVVPDWVGPVFDSECNACPLIPYQESMFIEVKAKAGSITMSTSRHQIRGYLDIAEKSPAGRMPGVAPSIFFVTTSNTTISPQVVLEATKRGIHVFQMIGFEVDGKIGFSPAKLLTPSTLPNLPSFHPTMPVLFELPKYKQNENDPDPETVE